MRLYTYINIYNKHLENGRIQVRQQDKKPLYRQARKEMSHALKSMAHQLFANPDSRLGISSIYRFAIGRDIFRSGSFHFILHFHHIESILCRSTITYQDGHIPSDLQFIHRIEHGVVFR